MVGSSRNCNWKVRGYWTHEFITGRADSDFHDVGEVVVVPWSFWTYVTWRVVSLFQSRQQGLDPLCIAEDDSLRNDTL